MRTRIWRSSSNIHPPDSAYRLNFFCWTSRARCFYDTPRLCRTFQLKGVFVNLTFYYVFYSAAWISCGYDSRWTFERRSLALIQGPEKFTHHTKTILCPVFIQGQNQHINLAIASLHIMTFSACTPFQKCALSTINQMHPNKPTSCQCHIPTFPRPSPAVTQHQTNPTIPRHLNPLFRLRAAAPLT
jgi:hypothetical protein